VKEGEEGRKRKGGESGKVDHCFVFSVFAFCLFLLATFCSSESDMLDDDDVLKWFANEVCDVLCCCAVGGKKNTKIE